MEIVYFWVNNYRNLRNVGVNFGSEYHFELMVDKNTQTCIVDTTPNPKHLKCFFNPFVNITAIVGENASGKSSLLEALRMALDGNPRDYFEYVIIYNDGKNSYYYKYFLGYIKEESEPTGFFFDKQRELSYDFNFKTHGLTFEQRDHNHRHETIFFSQLIDLNIYPLNNDTPLGIDISSNWLSYMACNTQKENNLPYEPLAFFKNEETKRQLRFINEVEDSFSENLTIPKHIRVNSYFTSDYLPGKNQYHNTNSLLRGFDKDLLGKIDIEIKNLNYNDKSHEITFLNFLHDTIRCIYRNMERSNRHYDTKFDLTISTSDLTTLSANDAIKTFFNNQNLIDGCVVLNFIEKVKQSIFDSNYTNFAGGISYWQIEINETIHGLLKALEGFLNEMSKFTDYGAPYNLLFFDWDNMSTGEKAYLNFFSRFYDAKLQILVKLNKPAFQGSPNQLPETIYILIDEGEIGFHLSWQQKFVQLMHKLLPQTFSFQDHTVKIQLIFTTHSPISLSDIPNDHIVYLRNGTVDNKVRKTFGANISELIADSFYFSNGLIGDFVKDKINQTIEWLNNEKDDSNYDYHQKLIELIDEPIIQRKLAEMYSEKLKSPFSKMIAIEQIDKQIRELNAKKDSLKSDGL